MIKVTTLKNIFDIQYGSQLDLNKLDITDDKNGINFVNRSANNLGISCKVEKLKYKNVFEQGLLTVALGGSILETFVQPEPFYTGQNVKVLTPKIEMSFNQKIYYAMCIKANAFRYSTMGREANTSLNNILVPTMDSIPDWVEKIKVPTVPDDSVLDVKLLFKVPNKSDWKMFDLVFIFDLSLGKPIHKVNIGDNNRGSVAYITRTIENNGIELYLKSDYHIEKKSKGNCITIGAEGLRAYYQKKDFYTGNKINILKCPELNKYNALFIATILNLEMTKKFNYGRAAVKSRLEKLSIKLPTDKNGNPDWQFMEDYIKSLPYSSNL